MTTRYGRSPGGYLWALIEPLGVIVILAFGFSLLLRAPALGSSFILFYATGYLPFSLYQSTSELVARAIRFSKPLLAYPRVSWIDAILARLVLNTLTGLLVAYILLAVIMGVSETRTVLRIEPILAAMGLSVLLGLAVGTTNCLLMGLFPVWERIWGIVNRPLFLASGVIFLYEDVPRVAQDYLWFNPLMHVVGLMRTGFYPLYSPSYVSVVYVLGVTVVPLAFSLLLLRRYHTDIIAN